jgi:hypothetical protein
VPGFSLVSLRKRSLGSLLSRVEPHNIITIIVYRPKLSIFFLAVGLLRLSKIQQKEKGNFQNDI